MEIKSLSGEEMLALAEERIFSLGMRDLSSVLSYKNMRHALGKMMYALGSKRVYCVFAPDATITRNKGRWLSGYGYGGLIRWRDENVAFPEIRPNACGMLLMQLDELPEREELVRRASEANGNELTLDGVEIKPDFGKGNHFFEFYEPMEVSEETSEVLSSDDYYAVLHSSAPELKGEVYSYAGNGEKVETPLGRISVLKGEKAEEYYETWNRLESFSKRRRELLAEELMGSYDLISNFTHQGLFSRNEARLGCYDTMDGEGKNHLFPVALRWDTPVYIFKGKNNLSEETLDRLEFAERSEKLNLEDNLKNANILPHGGGYDLKLSYRNTEITNTDFGNVFTLSDPKPAVRVEEAEEERGISKFGKMTISNPRELPYSYRGESVIRRTVELDLSDPVAKLRPILTVKI